jgi:exosortase/archaeosortase family protein
MIVHSGTSSGRGSGAAKPARPPARPGIAPRAPLGFFVLRLFGCWCAGFLIMTFIPGLERMAIGATVGSLVPSLRLVLPGVQRIGDQVAALGVSFQIASDCTPLVPVMLLWGAIAAISAPVSTKLIGLVAGLVILWVYNMVRIALLIVVLARFSPLFDLVHVYLWQTTTILVIVGVFALWLRLVATRRGG